jgi:hypothetical protein
VKAITTKYHGPTETRGARVVASDEDGNRVSIPYQYELSGKDVHRKAAVALCDKMHWTGADTLVGGGIKHGYVFVFTA